MAHLVTRTLRSQLRRAIAAALRLPIAQLLAPSEEGTSA